MSTRRLGDHHRGQWRLGRDWLTGYCKTDELVRLLEARIGRQLQAVVVMF